MKFTNKIAAAVAVAMLACVTPTKAQTIDCFSTLRILNMSGASNMIAASALFTTNGPYDMAGYVGRGILIANAATNGPGAGTLSFKLESSPDTTNWTGISNFATITYPTLVAVTNLSVMYNQMIYTSTNFVVTNQYMLPYTQTAPSSPYLGFNTPWYAPNLFTNAAGYTYVYNNTNVVWSVNANDQQRYWHIIWVATGIATNGLIGTSGTNAQVGATWIGNRINAP